MAGSAPTTLYDKIFEDHVVERRDDGTCVLYIDRHLVHEVTSPQAFEGLRLAGRKVRAARAARSRSSTTTSPTTDRREGIKDEESRIQVETLAANVKEFGVEYYDELDPRQGIVHVIGPEQGFTLPGTTIVCGDSHTSTHGAFGALAHGIGTSEVEHVLATQTLLQRKAKNMRITVDGKTEARRRPKDIVLAIIGKIGTAGGTGYVIEYGGEAIRAMSMEGRMTVCNMSIEGGARAGMVAPDDKTFAYLKGRPKSPKGAAWDMPRCATGRRCAPTTAPTSTRPCTLDAAQPAADRDLGHEPRDGRDHRRHDARSRQDRGRGQTGRGRSARSTTWACKPNTKMTDIEIDVAWIGSCTNGRIEDMREVAKIVEGKRISPRLAYAPRRSRLRSRQAAGRGRGAGQDHQGGRLRVARAGLLDVPRHEP